MKWKVRRKPAGMLVFPCSPEWILTATLPSSSLPVARYISTTFSGLMSLVRCTLDAMGYHSVTDFAHATGSPELSSFPCPHSALG